MHMADALISPAVGGVMMAVSAGAIGYSAKKIKEDIDDKKVPLMGVMGAFVFSAQMINFTIPGTGSSGHIGGGILLASLLGPYAAFLVISSVLVIQALFFADGGLLALGCNIFNMGVLTCFVAYPLIFKMILNKNYKPKRISIAAIAAVVVGLQLGAFSVVLETIISNITDLTFTSFVLLMQPIHLAIGLVEGAVTAAVLCFICGVNPTLLDGYADLENVVQRVSRRKVITLLFITALVIGGLFSLLASGYPDGLEWAMQRVLGTSDLEISGNVHKIATGIQSITALFPDYGLKGGDPSGGMIGTAVSGIIGGAITLFVACMAGLVINKSKRKVKASSISNH